MNLLEVPTKGQVIFEGNDLTEKGTQVDKLRQKWVWYFKTSTYFHIKVVDNIILAPKLLKKDNNDELHKEALSLLDKVGLKEKADVYRINYQVVKTKGSNCKSFSNASRCYFIR